MQDKHDPILNQIPVLNAGIDFEIRENIVFIIKKNDTKLHRFFRKFKSNIPKQTEIEFDKISSRAFMLIDGRRNIYEIGQIIEEEFKEESHPLYERLVVFFDGLNVNLNYINLESKD